MLSLVWVNLVLRAFERHLYDRHYVILENLMKVNILTLLLHQDLRGLFERHLIALLKLAIVLIKLLNSIVCQMNKRLIYGLLT